MNREKLLRDAFEYGRIQIKEGNFSLPIVNSNFKKMIEINNITEEKNKQLTEELKKSFINGQAFEMKESIKKAMNLLTTEQIKKYEDDIKYDEDIDEFSNFYDLHEKLLFIEKIKEIEKIKSNVKVLVFWSESNVFNENEVFSIEQFKEKCEKALFELRKEQQRKGIYGTYDKTKFMFVFEDDNGKIITTNPLRYDIGDYQNFETYLNKGFSNKNIPRLVQKYLGLEQIPEDEEEEVQ